MAYKPPRSEPIAIVGSGCRFAGGVSSPSQLWSLLSNPTDLTKYVPKDRFNWEGFYHTDGEYHGTTNAPKAYWLEQDHRVFDASFFSITPKEAEAIDPQQRMLLEVVYEAMESAGYTLQTYAGQNVAVFAGLMTADYDTLSQRDDITASQYSATGNSRAILSNRISYFFNFHGPSMTIDTACSSSLVALHQAVMSLRAGESPMACVAGANLMFTPEQFISESSLHMLSPTGHSRMWDVDADGYARGEGVTALLLKPLSRALADGDNIISIVRETGVNSDGRTKGITMPSPEAQAALIEATYRKTGLDPRSRLDRCQYFEAHGTGTQAGDPREALAIRTAFFGTDDGADSSSDDDNKLLVGSVKTVIGHTEGAAGLAGLLKVVASMDHEAIPPNMHLRKLNPTVAQHCKHLQVPTAMTAWPAVPAGHPLRASVNSFGFGGTNSHAILERYDPAIHNKLVTLDKPLPCLGWREVENLDAQQRPVNLPVVVSANSQQSLVKVVEKLCSFVAGNSNITVDRLAWDLYANRTALPYKLAIAAPSRSVLLSRLLTQLDKVRQAPNAEFGKRSRALGREPKILGIFTGQGAQWANMGRQLIGSSVVFGQTIKHLDEVLKTCRDPPSWSIEHELTTEGDPARFNVAALSQPLCTAIQIALVDLVTSMGLKFRAVVGHSSGGIAAAYAAGVLSARDALLLSYYRGLFANLAGGAQGQKGGMMAAGMTRPEAEELCAQPEYAGKVWLAASNAPSTVTLSGDLEVVTELQKKLSEQGKFARLLVVDTAYHTPHMTRPGEEYVKALEACGISALGFGSDTEWVSAVYGDGTRPELASLGSTYWRDNMVRPVLFYEAVSTALKNHGPFDCAVEIGPHPALKGPTTQTMKEVNGSAVPYIGILSRGVDDRVAFGEFLSFFWTQFGPSALPWEEYVAHSSQAHLLQAPKLRLPTYAWDHSQIHYKESRPSRQYHQRTHRPHELLGIRTRDDNQFELRWRNILKLDNIPWVDHHKFQGQALVPASAYCVLALDAARVLADGQEASIVELEDLQFISGITIDADTPGVEVLFSLAVEPTAKTTVGPQTIGASFTITSCIADGSSPMKMNFRGKMRIILGAPSPNALPSRGPSVAELLHVNSDNFYKNMSELGLDYSGPFRALENIERRWNCSTANLLKFHPDDTTTLSVSPATLDSCFQSCFAAYMSPGDKSLWTSFLPRVIERIRFNLALVSDKQPYEERLTVDSVLTSILPPTKDSSATFGGDMSIYNSNGEMEIQVEGLVVTSFANGKPEDDYELYLTSVYEVDPEDQIVAADSLAFGQETDILLKESCERVCRFYGPYAAAADMSHCLTPTHSSVKSFDSTSSRRMLGETAWSNETNESLDAFISQSPYFQTLDFVRLLGENLPDLLPAMMGTIQSEAMQMRVFQSHFSHVVGQIAHRYPRMKLLTMTTPESGLNESVLKGLGESFVSAHIGLEPEKNLFKRLPGGKAVEQKTMTLSLDLEKELESQLKQDVYDLVIVSTAIAEDAQFTKILSGLQQAMRPGAFLILVHASVTPIKNRLRRVAGLSARADHSLTPPEYPDVLERCGFAKHQKNSEQFFAPGISLIVRQKESTKHVDVASLTQSGQKAVEHLLILGGRRIETAKLAGELEREVAPICNAITTIHDFDRVHESILHAATAIVVLADLDEPLMSNMTTARLDSLRTAMAPEKVVLWLTLNSRKDNPEHAATFGFTRSIVAEVPSLRLQVLDLENLDCAKVVADTFARLADDRLSHNAPSQDSLWSFEREIHLENGRRMVPRVLPWRSAINRLNAARRVVTEEVNTAESCVEVIARQNSAGVTTYEAVSRPLPPTSVLRDLRRLSSQFINGRVSENEHIRVEYSTQKAVVIGEEAAHLCLGRDSSGALCAALSTTNASHNRIPASSLLPLSNINADPRAVLGLAARFSVLLSVLEKTAKSCVVLLDPDHTLLECLRQVLPSGVSIKAYSTTTGAEKAALGLTYLHPLTSQRALRAMFPATGAVVLDFMDGTSDISAVVRSCVPANCSYYPQEALFSAQATQISSKSHTVWQTAIMMAVEKASVLSESLDHTLISSVPALLVSTESASSSSSSSSSPFQLVDWKADRRVQCSVGPIVEPNLFRPDRTYVLIGLTRDFGQSLCNYFFEHGGRNFVVASRSPPTAAPKWRDDLMARGANVRIERLDVTSLESVQALKQRLADASMPPVGGVVNGAMVLDDRVFAQMDLDTWNRVLRPKTVGSKNLDVVFSSPDLEFFIMTSSFAAPGGHGGQSNYAAANMYMNGLAANRRSRNLPASVLNIGVIYGLGLLHRERDDIYSFLERDGYPPISERDLHHMFTEAVVAGRPTSNQIYDITTGLRRFKPDDARPLHWHVDARFSHLTVRGEEGGDSIAGSEADKQSLQELLAAAPTVDEAAAVLQGTFTRQLEKLLQLPEGSVSGESGISELGVDSLIAVEIRGWIWKAVARDVPVLKILGVATISKLCRDLAESIVSART